MINREQANQVDTNATPLILPSISEHQALWEKIQQFDLSVVTDTLARREPKYADSAEALEAECRRFLFMAAIVPELEHAPTKPIDDYWHQFILFTRMYKDFCKDIIGRFVHHKPLGADDHQAVFDRTQGTVVRLFGDFPNKSLWMMPAPATSCCSAIDNDMPRAIAA
ncbi:MAG: hypothetical protein ACI9VM_000360 [Candidatus Azotimanducaceae bacterium]|jgi:hypothetical protein